MAANSAKKTITRAEYLQLVGLITLAQHHTRALAEIEKAACVLTGELEEDGSPVSGGFVGDAVYELPGRADVDELLRHLGLTVVE